MAVMRIAKMGNPALKMVAEPVANPSAPRIEALARDMQATLEDIGASGLAAPQIMVNLRVVVYRMIPARIPAKSGIDPIPWTVMINPEITPLTKVKTEVWERCLSVPGLHGKVPRWPNISIRYQTLLGDWVSHGAHSSWAALLQHECDHLDGILYPARMTNLSLLSYNDEPGPLAEDIATNGAIDPLFKDLVVKWPARQRWFPTG